MTQHTPLQDSDDAHFLNQPGSGAGAPETLIGQDSPHVVPERETGIAKEGTLDIVEAGKGTRDDGFEEVHDKDKNLREQFISNEVDAQSRK